MSHWTVHTLELLTISNLEVLTDIQAAFKERGTLKNSVEILGRRGI